MPRRKEALVVVAVLAVVVLGGVVLIVGGMTGSGHNGPVQPFGSQVSTGAIGGRSYDVWFGKQAWNTITYSMVTGTTSVQDLDIGQFAADALRRGYIGKSWYLTDVEAGFELWQGGAGLATDSFAVNVPGGSSAPTAAGATAAGATAAGRPRRARCRVQPPRPPVSRAPSRTRLRTPGRAVSRPRRY